MQKIKEQLKKVIEHSQQFTPDIEDIFDDWKENKEWFIKKFGGLIYEYPEAICFELDQKAKEERVKALEEYFLEEGYFDLAHFLMREKDGFFDNKVIEEYVMADGKIISKNMKLLKAFKYFIVNNPVKLNKFQMKASSIIQENKVNGKLCLSVHPLDYLSSSEDTYNWRSCHSLNGTYRAGTLSYMTDDCTIVCYLKGEKDTKLPRFPDDVLWNNKKWRMLIHMNQERTLMFAGRQYPFHSIIALSTLHKICEEIFNDYKWTQWSNYYQEDIHKRYLKLPITYALEDIVSNCEYMLHFDDLLQSRYYTKPYYSCACSSKGELQIVNPNIEVGHDVYCLYCGEHLIEPACDTMMCFNCELEYGTTVNNTWGFCSCCDERIILDDAEILEYNHNVYCAACFQEQVVQCCNCGELFDKNDVEEDCGEYYCSECWEYKNEEDIEY